MKITVGQLRRIIREVVETESQSSSLDDLKKLSIPGLAAWISYLSRQPDPSVFSAQWDAMKQAIESGDFKSQTDAGVWAKKNYPNDLSVSFYMKKMVGGRGFPSGDELAAAILADRQQKQQDVERAKAERAAELAKPGAVFDREITDSTDRNYGRKRYVTIQIQPDGSEKVIRTYVDREGSLGGT